MFRRRGAHAAALVGGEEDGAVDNLQPARPPLLVAPHLEPQLCRRRQRQQVLPHCLRAAADSAAADCRLAGTGRSRSAICTREITCRRCPALSIRFVPIAGDLLPDNGRLAAKGVLCLARAAADQCWIGHTPGCAGSDPQAVDCCPPSALAPLNSPQSSTAPPTPVADLLDFLQVFGSDLSAGPDLQYRLPGSSGG